jgi:hypothetical protein
MILYVPFFRGLFQITPLNWTEWQAVLWISAPVIVIDEILKWVSNRLSKSSHYNPSSSRTGLIIVAVAPSTLAEIEGTGESKKDL